MQPHAKPPGDQPSPGRRVSSAILVGAALAGAALVAGRAGPRPALAEPEGYTVEFEPAVGEIDPRLPAYRPPENLTGRLDVAGSSTFRAVAEAWVSGFGAKCPKVEVDYDAIGSRNAIPALIGGSVLVCVTSRPMTEADEEEFRRRHGYPVVALTGAMDVYAVFVHKDHPVRGLTMPELDGMWSSTRARGGPEIDRWGKLGCAGEWDRPIALHMADSDLARNASGGMVLSLALKGGRPRDDISQQDDASMVYDRVAADKSAAGFATVIGRPDTVRPLALDDGNGRSHGPTHAALRAGRYPLARRFHIYVNKRPGKPLDPVVREFLRYVFSRDGAEAVTSAHRVPLAKEMAEDMLELVK
jgi:phosphate transport system substrate-binding protein